jgi:RNA polymerase sigma factor (sigma-70 family)
MDRQTFTTLYRPLAPLIHRRCRHLLGSEEDARDATQEVFVQLLLYADRVKFAGEEDALRWLYRVSTNHCLKLLCKRRCVDLREPSDMPQVPVRVGTVERLISRQTLQAVLDAVDERARAVFVHTYIDGMTQEDTAAVMQVSRRTVGKKIGRLRSVAERLVQDGAV